jgi:hypothetical protein
MTAATSSAAKTAKETPKVERAVESTSEVTGTIQERLLVIQRTLKVEKAQWNDFSKFKYRSKEDILEAAKPLCHERGLVLVCNDSIFTAGNGWVYVESTASVIDAKTGISFSAKGYAREPESKKGMDGSQITGTASSYAGKRALGNLFAIDDTKDSDAPSAVPPSTTPDEAHFPAVAHCRSCGARYQFDTKEHFEAYVKAATCCPHPDYEIEQ